MTDTLISGIDPASFSSVIKPSDDFFRYVNGPWIDTYSLPEDRARFGAFDKLAENAEKDVRDILEDEDSPAIKSAVLYRSFLNQDAIDAAGIEPLRPDLDAVDSAADKAALTRVLGAINPAGGPDLIGLMVYPNPGDPDINVAHVEQAGLALPDEAYYREDRYEQVRAAYVDMVANLLQLSKYAATGDEASRTAERFLDVEKRIARHHWDVVATRDEDKTYNPTDYADLKSTLADFDIEAWAQAWQTAYDQTVAAGLLPIDMHAVLAKTIVHEPSFLTGINRFWAETDLDDLKLWARVHLLIGWAGYLSHEFDQARFDFYGKVLSGTTKQRDRWKRAVSLVNGISGEDVGREYVRRHFPDSSKQRMEELVANLISAYRASIQASDWLGEETKGKALEKLSKFSPKIGYTNHWRDYGALSVSDDLSLVENLRNAFRYEAGYQLSKAGKAVDKDEWLMNPQTVNAYYEPTMNVIVFPAAILQPPFFDPNAEDAANYGGIGAVIGHEIGHGFDDQGSKYNGDGKLHDWWTAEDRANFENRTKALIEQYNGFVPAQLAEKYAAAGQPEKAPHVNGALTIGENIGDLGGVNIAIKAYAISLGAPNGSAEAVSKALEKAPVIDGFTGAQRFFLSYASIWRGKNRDELAEQYLQIDPHSPAEFRTNGIVRNVDLFYKAFGVTENDKMWLAPDQRVRIW
ncbi:peptidase M13 [Bifidobacterium callimiconis]|uniref:M13 family metallopeptidase n=1 Tax=Bifidobacterium callimiconis TaxID=2306973 RepID=UPI001BDD5560|nr:M13-type metalloendopeptidase [Bifidobacterium callimiconis]MBT1177500.1 peptidase M13 [Bifidobacterium callimiconis]